MNAPRWVIWLALAVCLAIAGFLGWHRMTHRLAEGLITMPVTFPGAPAATECPVRWPPASLPVPVTVELASADDLRAPVLDAIRFWNSAIGARVFEYAGEAQNTDGALGVVVTAEYRESAFSRPEAMGAMRPSFDTSCFLRRADVAIRTDPMQFETERRRAIDHELGHALGLGHDETEERVMNPDLRWVGSTLGDAARRDLRAAYLAP